MLTSAFAFRVAALMASALAHVLLNGALSLAPAWSPPPRTGLLITDLLVTKPPAPALRNAGGEAGASSEMNSGDDLLSQGVSPQVPSALAVFTSVFGMGTGVSPPLSPPETYEILGAS